MINPSNATQTIVTLPQIKNILATATVTTIVKIKARKQHMTNETPEALTKTITIIKE